MEFFCKLNHRFLEFKVVHFHHKFYGTSRRMTSEAIIHLHLWINTK